VGSLLVLLALGWVAWRFLVMGPGSRRKARAEVTALSRAGFKIDDVLKGNIYVLFDHSNRKIAFVFTDKSFVCDYGEVRSVTRYWLSFAGLKLRNTMVFATHGKKIRCGNLSARQARYWQRRSVELMAA